MLDFGQQDKPVKIFLFLSHLIVPLG